MKATADKTAELDEAVKAFKAAFNPITVERREKQRKAYALYVQLAWQGKAGNCR